MILCCVTKMYILIFLSNPILAVSLLAGHSRTLLLRVNNRYCRANRQFRFTGIKLSLNGCLYYIYL